MGGSNILVHTVNIIPKPGAGLSYPVASQPDTQSPLVPTPGEILPAGGSKAPVYASPMPPTQPGMAHASRMRIILDCRDASTVPSVLDLLTLMDQDRPMQDQKYVDALSEFYDFGVEDILDVFDMPCGLLASLGDLGNDRAHQLHDYVRDKLLLPLGLLETGLKMVVGGKDEDLVVKQGGDSSIVELGSQDSIIELGSQRVVVKTEGSSVVEVKGCRSVVGAGGDDSVVKIAVTQVIPQAPVADGESKEYNTDEEEGWSEEDSWVINEECEERVLDWLAGVWEAGENVESDSDASHEV